MGGVEEQKNPKTKRKNSSKLVMAKAYSIILALALIGASLHLVTYSTLGSTETSFTPIGIPRNVLYNLAHNETLEITTNIQYSDSIPSFVVGLNGSFDKWCFTIRQPQQTLTGWDETTIWLEPEYVQSPSIFYSTGTSITIYSINQTNSEPHNITLFLHNPIINHTMTYDFSNLEIEVISPDGLVKHENVPMQIDAHESAGFPSTPITQEGTYTFKLSNPKNWEQSGTLSLNIQIQHFERPYFYFGVTGIIIAVGYIILVTIMAIKSKGKSEQ
ncbi:MAG: hypothetical protein JW702_04735 [Clostridiales bacterium]|nr:hypothetical protein [Clostridiales bacterium]